MTPKEKAESLIYKYKNLINYDLVTDLQWRNPMDEERNKRVLKDAKKLALAAVEEIILQNDIWIMQVGKGSNNYWIEVKNEIQNNGLKLSK